MQYRPDKSCCLRFQSEATPWPIRASSLGKPTLWRNLGGAVLCYREFPRTLVSTASAAELNWCTASSRWLCSRKSPRFRRLYQSISATTRLYHPPPLHTKRSVTEMESLQRRNREITANGAVESTAQS